jgi:aspartate racemase
VAKRIGILGGISAESTAEYYLRIIRGASSQQEEGPYPEVVIYSLDFQRFTAVEDSDDRAAYIAEIMTGIRALERAGAEFILMAANSPHVVFDDIQALASVPLLSIVEVTASEAQARGLSRLLLLGIRFTMQASFYQDACRRVGVEVITPDEPEQDEINHIIFDELTRAIFQDASRARLLDIISRYAVDGVILGCTELPLILKPGDAPVVLLDTLGLHVRAALDYALG